MAFILYRSSTDSVPSMLLELKATTFDNAVDESKEYAKSFYNSTGRYPYTVFKIMETDSCVALPFELWQKDWWKEEEVARSHQQKEERRQLYERLKKEFDI